MYNYFPFIKYFQLFPHKLKGAYQNFHFDTPSNCYGDFDSWLDSN